jgi:nickel/cobalt transporter (NiCoT) family protein
MRPWARANRPHSKDHAFGGTNTQGHREDDRHPGMQCDAEDGKPLFRTVKRGGRFIEEDLDLMLASRGFFSRASFDACFGLSSDRGTCIRWAYSSGLDSTRRQKSVCSAISATQAAQGMSAWTILVFPALFTAGMTLVDTTDSILMLGACGWTFVKPIRKLYYNLTIIGVSVVIVVIVGGLEAMNLIGDQLNLTDSDGFWGIVGTLKDNIGILGYVIVGIFVAAWLLTYAIHRLNRYDEIEVYPA